MSTKITRRTLLASSAVLGASLGTGARPARAQEVTLRAVSAWTAGTAFSKPFERYVEHVNETGKGVIKINYLGGGAKIMNIFDMGKSLRSGVFDMLNSTSGYYGDLMPEANTMKLKRVPYAKFRENGGYAAFDGLMQKKVNAKWVGRGKGDVPFNLYLSEKAVFTDKPDLHGLKLRVSPNYRAFFTALGATLVQTQPSEIYTSMERNVVDGYGWPIQGIDELGLLPVTKRRIEPSFFVAPNEIMVNLDVYNKLTAAQKKVLDDSAAWVETWLDKYEAEENAKAKKLQADNGIKTVEMSAADAEKYLKIAYDSSWEEIRKIAGDGGMAFRKYMAS
jgi:TRAP-type C4-dicarboxylate transport system substrate-binding protein